MTSVDDIVSQPTAAHSTFAHLCLGQSPQIIVARLLRVFEESPTMNNDSEARGITILLLDEKDSTITGFIPAAAANRHREALKEGVIIKVTNFEVKKCQHMFKITEHTHAIRFTSQTTIDEVMNNYPAINQQRFMVRGYEHLQILANTDLELPGIYKT
ncbi:unnamed protein product [Eruca vesicaria subsp. sativa]|uniref:Replication protein A 70 kDa DNA-binding subunit B/D first OB fold domain-containing protein n=1 Tax=Eruca vesicaria subsp. sativa TaxID=29727 RepID=A0ABC8MA02_ERUVS|nr:unnamed protein product [Eruca vesicaria subsp. sativa]